MIWAEVPYLNNAHQKFDQSLTGLHIMWLRSLPAKCSNWRLTSMYPKSCHRQWTGSWMWAELACHQHCKLHWPQIWIRTKASKPPQESWRRSPSSPSSKLLSLKFQTANASHGQSHKSILNQMPAENRKCCCLCTAGSFFLSTAGASNYNWLLFGSVPGVDFGGVDIV
jgi:hypothetical protein